MKIIKEFCYNQEQDFKRFKTQHPIPVHRLSKKIGEILFRIDKIATQLKMKDLHKAIHYFIDTHSSHIDLQENDFTIVDALKIWSGGDLKHVKETK